MNLRSWRGSLLGAGILGLSVTLAMCAKEPFDVAQTNPQDGDNVHGNELDAAAAGTGGNSAGGGTSTAGGAGLGGETSPPAAGGENTGVINDTPLPELNWLEDATLVAEPGAPYVPYLRLNMADLGQDEGAKIINGYFRDDTHFVVAVVQPDAVVVLEVDVELNSVSELTRVPVTDCATCQFAGADNTFALSKLHRFKEDLGIWRSNSQNELQRITAQPPEEFEALLRNEARLALSAGFIFVGYSTIHPSENRIASYPANIQHIDRAGVVSLTADGVAVGAAGEAPQLIVKHPCGEAGNTLRGSGTYVFQCSLTELVISRDFPSSFQRLALPEEMPSVGPVALDAMTAVGRDGRVFVIDLNRHEARYFPYAELGFAAFLKMAVNESADLYAVVSTQQLAFGRSQELLE